MFKVNLPTPELWAIALELNLPVTYTIRRGAPIQLSDGYISSTEVFGGWSTFCRVSHKRRTLSVVLGTSEKEEIVSSILCHPISLSVVMANYHILTRQFIDPILKGGYIVPSRYLAAIGDLGRGGVVFEWPRVRQAHEEHHQEFPSTEQERIHASKQTSEYQVTTTDNPYDVYSILTHARNANNL